jgi:serine phosphatase RsbU (regulator of sigma subunit)
MCDPRLAMSSRPFHEGSSSDILAAMELTWSLEELARTSDEAIVRRRFDQRNLVMLLVLLIFFLIVSFGEMSSIDRRNTDVDVYIAFGNLVLVAAMLVLVRDLYRLKKAGPKGTWRVARWMRNHISATVLTYIAVQYALVLLFTRHANDWIAWAMCMPLLMLGFRMLMAELVLLHAMLLFGALIVSFVLPESNNEIHKFYIGLGVINGLTLGIELFASYRLRREVVSYWGERRAQAREQIRMRDELHYARELQLSMLPEHAPELPWADLSAISIPATEVGGDYYDYFVDGDRVALVCGDVAGHGMAAGLVLAALRSGFTLLRDSLTDPAAVLKRLHDLVAETSRRRMLVTVAVVLLDQRTRRAIVASAGHPPVIVARADGTLETLELFAPPLGVRLPVAIPQRTVDARPGDIFVLHSDGIYETRNAREEIYGLERLGNVIRRHAAESAQALRDAIVADVDQFRGSATPDDDVTVVVAKMR